MVSKALEDYLKGTLNVRSRRDAVRVLADRIPRSNRGKLCQRLHRLLETGEAPPDLIQAVRDVLTEGGAAGFDAALVKTRAVRRARQDTDKLVRRVVDLALAGVHLWVEHERRRPSQITIVAMTGLDHWKRIQLPQDLPRRDWDEQCEVVAYYCRQWLQVRGPRCPLFGRVTGFLYFPHPWVSYPCSLDGHVRPDEVEFRGPLVKRSVR